MTLQTTCIGAYPKPELVKLPEWFNPPADPDTADPTDLWEKTERFQLEEVAENKIILAHGVNGQPLPERHGFPLRLVAEDHYGDEWVKCVVKIIVLPG